MMRGFAAVPFVLVFGACTQLASPVANVNFLSIDQEKQVAAQFAQDVESKQTVLRDADVESYVADLGRRLAATLTQPEFTYKFQVLQDQNVNAFNIGGGYIYLYSGLVKTAGSEGQLASVMSHEMGHQIHRHVAKAISRDQLFQTLAQFAVGSNASQWIQLGASLGITTGQLYFGREAERQADSEMVPIMIRAGYDPNEALAMFAKLQQMNDTEPSKVAILFSSHPPTAERIDSVRREIQATKLPANLVRDSPRFHDIQRRLP